jgi:uncharacterized damage-inducible protein DinB
MKSFFQDLYAFNHHFNLQLIEQFEQQETSLPEKCIPLFSHMLNAHQIWNARMLELPTFGVFDVHLVTNMAQIAENNQAHSLDILERFELTQVIVYRNSEGEVFTNTVQDLLFHVINHTTYHRGQIMADFRNGGLKPLVSDYVFYRRR